MSVAERTREAVRAEPFLYDALRAGVVNYTAAARYLDVGDQEAVAAALRRYAEDLPSPDPDGDARVTMESGLGEGDPSAALLSVGDIALAPGGGPLTGILATGAVGPSTLRGVLGRCATADIEPVAAGVGDGTLVVAVERRDGPDVLRLVEGLLDG